MKNRVLVSVVGIPFLLFMLGFAPTWVTMILVMGMCGVGAWELMHAVTDNTQNHLVLVVSLVAAYLPQWLYTHEKLSDLLIGGLAFGFVLFLFLYAIFNYEKEKAIPFATILSGVFAGLVFPLMLSCLLRLRMMEHGELLVFVPLAVAFGSDTFALFGGMLCGRHKLAPHVSPKKTREGAVGGIIGGIIGMTLMEGVSYWLLGVTFGWVSIFVVGIIGSLISQIGDLSFSVIKREYGVKDYGKILPGHGGILDRFDSVTFVAPAIWLLFSLLGGLT